MLNWIILSDPKKPGSFSHALVQNKQQERMLRNNAAQQGLISGPSRPIHPTDDFWRFQNCINRK
jgi:hypothetical protein